MESNQRIEIFDGLRVIAILMVMIYHFFDRFDGIIYSYSFIIPQIISYGSLGVQLFFIISGFVITLTLTKCKSYSEFILKRLVRLIPGMLICSCLTFLSFYFLDGNNLIPQSKGFSNLILSNTFISPDLLNNIFGTSFDYIDGSYWSLWVEFEFYIIAGIIYFLSPKNFLRNYATIAILLTPVALIFVSKTGQLLTRGYISAELYEPIHSFFSITQLFHLNLWFLIGIIINKLYFGNRRTRNIIFLFFVFGLQILILRDWYSKSFTLLIIGIFMLFLFRPQAIGFLGNKTLSKVGVASYSIYLIHENIGVFVINKLSRYFGEFNFILPIILIGLFILFGLISYKYLEGPIGKKIRDILFSKTLIIGPIKTALTGLKRYS